MRFERSTVGPDIGTLKSLCGIPRSVVMWAGIALFVVAQTAYSAEPSSRQLLPPDASVILEVRQPQIAFQHVLVQRLLPILSQSRAFQDTLGNPDLDIFRDSLQHFETELGVLLPQIVESCAGESLLISSSAEASPQFAAVLTGRDSERVARLPEITLSLARKIMAGRGQNLPDPLRKTHLGHSYYQFGEAFYAISGPRWLLANRESILRDMLDRLNGQLPKTNSGVVGQLANSSFENPGVRLIADLTQLKKLPALQPVAKWPPQDLGPVILAAGWLDLIQRSGTVVFDLDLGHNGIVASIQFPAAPENLTPGTDGFFASEPQTAAAPLLQPPRLIYSGSWYRDYQMMWENRRKVPLPDGIKQLETQLEAVEKGNLGYSAFDMIRLIGPHHRVVVTRPGPNPYRIEMTDRLPAFGLVLDVRDEQEFKNKVLLPIQRIIGIVAVTNQMVIQTLTHQSAEISTLKFTEDPASVQNSDRVRYNFEPSYSVTRGHLIVGSSSHMVRALIDDLDRLAKLPVIAQTKQMPGVTEQQTLHLSELAQVLTDIHGLAVRNAVLNDGLTIGEAESELAIVQTIVTTLGQLQVHAGFGEGGFEYRLNLLLSGDR